MSKASILVVENEKIVARDIQLILQRAGYTVPAIANSGEQAIAQAAQQQPDLVLIDTVLQDKLDGIQAASQIKQRHNIPIIYLTAYGDEAIVECAKATEPLAYILKPYEERSLLTTIEIALNQYQQNQLRADEALRQSEELWRTVFAAANDAILVMDERFKILNCNTAAQHMYGYNQGDLLRLTLYDLCAPEAYALIEAQMQVTMRNHAETWEACYKRKDGTNFPAEVSAESFAVSSGHRFTCIVRDITARKQAEEELRASEEKFRLVTETIDDVFWMATPGATRMIYISSAYEKLWQMSRAELYASPHSFLSIIHPDDLDSYRKTFEAYHTHGQPYECEYRIQPADGSLHWIRERGFVIYDEAGNVRRMTGSCTDITERKRDNEALNRLNRALLMINQCNQILVRSNDESKLLQEMCETIVKVGGYRMAWVGFAEQDQEKRVRPVVQFGFEEGYLEQAQINWSDNEHGHGPTGTAVREGVTQVNQDFSSNPHMGPWREAALQRGYLSSIALPLKKEASTFGALTIYSSMPQAFDANEVSLLDELANDIAYGINALRERSVRKRAEEHIRLQKERAESLAEISQALSEINDYTQAINLVARQVAVWIGDLCVITMIADSGEELDVIAVHSRDPEAEQFARSLLESTPYRLSEGLAGRVAQSGEPLLISEAAPEAMRGLIAPSMHSYLDRVGIYAALIVPLSAEGKIFGTLGVTRDRPGHAYTTDDQTFLQNIAHRVAQTITNARLYHDAQRRARHLEALRAIDAAITSSLDMRLMLNVVVHQVISQLNADAAAVLLLNPHSQILSYAAGHGFRSKAIEHRRLRLGEGYAGRTVLDRRAIGVHNFSPTDPDIVCMALPHGEDFVCYHAAPLIAKGQVNGVLEVFIRSHHKKSDDWVAFFEMLAQQTAIAVDSAQLFENLQRSNLELFLAYDATIEGWSRAMDLRDKETEGHTQRVTEMTERMARAMGISEAEIVHIRRGALLHDIGKMGVPDHILLKPGKLTDEEWVLMRQHPQFAYNMLAPIIYLRPALDIPYCHHEKWDGTGYPRGLKGEQIPLAARLFAIVDVWDALLSERPYHPKWPEERVFAYLRSLEGTHFDPKVVELFFKVIGEQP